MNLHIKPDQLYLTVDQVAQRYGVSTDTIWRWARNGSFPKARRVGPNVTRWRLSDLEAHEQEFRACFAGYMSAGCSWVLPIAR